jgi:uncharacterized iron-regulated membrane protein
MMSPLKWAVRLHKWLALVIGLQIFLWLLGGLVMSALPIERVRGEYKIANHEPVVITPQTVITLKQAARSAGLNTVDEAALSTLSGAPVWRLRSGEQTVLVAAKDGERLSPVNEALARRIAVHDFAPDAPVASVRLLADPPSEYGPGGPVWQVRFTDKGDTRLYIDPDSGIVRARRSSTWRLFDLAWRLHVMDYDDGADFNHPLLVGAAFVAVLMAIAGLVILFYRMGRFLRAKRRRRKRSVPNEINSSLWESGND